MNNYNENIQQLDLEIQQLTSAKEQLVSRKAALENNWARQLKDGKPEAELFFNNSRDLHQHEYQTQEGGGHLN